MSPEPLNSDISEEAQTGYQIASRLRENTNSALGDILTMVETALGDTVQAASFKKLVKQCLWKLTDENQHAVYRQLEVEPYPVGSGELPNLER